jgi:hypothetical protein
MIEESKRLHASCGDSNGSDSNGSSLPCRNSRLIVPRFAHSQQPSAAVTMASHPAQKHSPAPPQSAAEPRQRSNRRSPPRSELEGLGVHPGQGADVQGDDQPWLIAAAAANEEMLLAAAPGSATPATAARPAAATMKPSSTTTMSVSVWSVCPACSASPRPSSLKSVPSTRSRCGNSMPMAASSR